ncbi:ferrous iron transport protein B [Salinibius halmophilus]|uniref:ferrous iron transport protein B n=1 Tax=Salinibius halmophilus TaxID=1853216 RepID=UPI0013144673|nr:ferrous iron transport protein B [Salinibius halmophilus]
MNYYLTGAPNCGKTTLFNRLTGKHQREGNWSGVTVELCQGDFAGHQITDIPGLYDLYPPASVGIDIQTAAAALKRAPAIINVINATQLSRSLLLTQQLIATGRPVIVVLNMMDKARARGIHIDLDVLSDELGAPVVALSAKTGEGIAQLEALLDSPPQGQVINVTNQCQEGLVRKSDEIAQLATKAVGRAGKSAQIDQILLHPWLAYPFFLLAMYAMFFFAVHFASAFIDFFDIMAGLIFVDGISAIGSFIGLPAALSGSLANGIGGGIQTVATFIPVLFFLYLFLGVLEDSGYMARVAFVMDRLLSRLGLSGSAFVPLLMGFGCNVPAISATRTLPNKRDRLITMMMAPFISCGARLPVYALFATAFFPQNGQNAVFALYLLGILVSVVTAVLLNRNLNQAARQPFILELPAYHFPSLRSLWRTTWRRLKQFIWRAGKVIVPMVLVINTLAGFNHQGQWHPEQPEQSLLANVGKIIAPAFQPIGIEASNWPAAVGLFTGVLAKEAVVGTLDTLYSPTTTEEAAEAPFVQVRQAVASIRDNLFGLTGALADPLGISIGAVDNQATAATEQGVQLDTLGRLTVAFSGVSAAFSYLAFILLYTPCSATIAAIYREAGRRWTIIAVCWTTGVAYLVAMTIYQASQLFSQALVSGGLIIVGWLVAAACFKLLAKYMVVEEQIPLRQLD